MTDPLGLSAFTDHIFASLAALAPVAVVGLFVILAIYGLVRSSR